MVLINNLTIDEINAALLHLQRSRSEVVGGTKGSTVNNITVNSSGNGGGYDVDYSSLIKQITDRLSNVETKASENESNINQQASVNANQQSLIEEIEETLNNLTQSGITQLYFDEQTRTLTIYTTEGQYNTEIPSEEVTMSLTNNVLTFTMGGQTVTVNMPYIPASEKGAAGGVATLDSSGRLPYSQLPESAMVSSVNNLSGDVVLNGTNVNYDATSGSPTLKSKIDSVDTKASTQVDWNEGNTSSLAYIKNKPTIPAAQIQSNWTQTDSTKKDFIKNKIPIWITGGQSGSDMTPVDNITDGQMRPPTSNAVFDILNPLAVSMGGTGQTDLANVAVGSSTTSNYSRQGAYCTTAAGTQAKVASMTGFAYQSGCAFPITFTNANSYNGKITLNINSTGAKDVWINGSVSSSSNKTLPAGTYICFCESGVYKLDTGWCVPYARSASSASSAGKLTTARKTYVTLGTASTTTTRDWSGDTTIPVNGTLGVANGGTGQTSLANVSVGNSDKVDGYHVSTASGTTKNDSLNSLVPVSKQYFTTTSGYIVYANGLMIQWYHASFNSSSQQTWTFPIPYTSKDSLAILPTNWANSNNTSPLQYKMFQKVIGSNNKCTGIKFMSLNGGEHDFLAIGY